MKNDSLLFFSSILESLSLLFLRYSIFFLLISSFFSFLSLLFLIGFSLFSILSSFFSHFLPLFSSLLSSPLSFLFSLLISLFRGKAKNDDIGIRSYDFPDPDFFFAFSKCEDLRRI